MSCLPDNETDIEMGFDWFPSFEDSEPHSHDQAISIQSNLVRSVMRELRSRLFFEDCTSRRAFWRPPSCAVLPRSPQLIELRFSSLPLRRPSLALFFECLDAALEPASRLACLSFCMTPVTSLLF